MRETLALRQSEKLKQSSAIRHIAHCTLAKTVRAMRELEEEKIHSIPYEHTLIEGLFTEGRLGFQHIATPILQDSGISDGACRKIQILTSSGSVEADMCSRAKDLTSILRKLIVKSKFNRESATKDAIGFKLSIKHSEIQKVVVALINYLAELNQTSKHLTIHNVRLETKGRLLSGEDIQSIIHQTADQAQTLPDRKIQTSTDTNPHSSSRYKDVKILFNISIGNIQRGVEIQIINKGSKNESGLANHDVYRLKQILAALSRLTGGIPPKRIERDVSIAHEKTGISPAKIHTCVTGSLDKHSGWYVDSKFRERLQKINDRFKR